MEEKILKMIEILNEQAGTEVFSFMVTKGNDRHFFKISAFNKVVKKIHINTVRAQYPRVLAEAVILEFKIQYATIIDVYNNLDCFADGVI